MQGPNVSNLVRDPKKNVIYDVVAYRTLTRQEMVQQVRLYHMQKKKKKPRPGSKVTIVTIIGHNE